MQVIKQIPNLLTLCNLLCGCIGIVSPAAEVQVLMILLGMCFDFADGIAARLLKAQSEIGKQLDSLADMVTFGVLPSLLLFNIIANDAAYPALAYLAFVYALGVGWRLARFNAFDTQKDYFVGLPSPAAAFVVASIAYTSDTSLLVLYFDRTTIALFFAILLVVLMVSNTPLLSLKFKNLYWQENIPRYLLILIAIILGVIWQLVAIPLIILIYVCLSVLFKEKIINQ